MYELPPWPHIWSRTGVLHTCGGIDSVARCPCAIEWKWYGLDVSLSRSRNGFDPPTTMSPTEAGKLYASTWVGVTADGWLDWTYLLNR